MGGGLFFCFWRDVEHGSRSGIFLFLAKYKISLRLSLTTMHKFYAKR